MTNRAPDPEADAIVAEHRRAFQQHAASYGDSPIDVSRPSPARRYDELQGGKDNFQADRASATQLQAALPSIRLAATELRRCLQRQVAYLAQAGVRQFLDVGCGLPHEPNVHDIAQDIDPSSRVVYVDNDQLVGSHARALLTGSPLGVTEFIDGDLTDISAVLNHKTTRAVLDFHQPIGVLLGAVLHFITDNKQAYTAVGQIKSALAPGSYVALTHVTFDPLAPDHAAHLTDLADSLAHGPFKARTRDEIAAFLAGLQIMEPGLVSTVEWQPDRNPRPEATVAEAVAYAAIGRAS
jgi:SAM-dependent methyltransferase